MQSSHQYDYQFADKFFTVTITPKLTHSHLHDTLIAGGSRQKTSPLVENLGVYLQGRKHFIT